MATPPIAPPLVHVRVLLFAAHQEALGRDELALALPAPARAGDALTAVRALPGGEALSPSTALAVNARWAAPDEPLADGDEVALIPPVAGG